MSRIDHFDPNDILIDQTMVYRASQIIDRHPAFSLHIESLLDLSILLDAMALHESLYVLRSKLPKDAEQLAFRELLAQKQILKELDKVPYSNKIYKNLQKFLSEIDLHVVKTVLNCSSPIEGVVFSTDLISPIVANRGTAFNQSSRAHNPIFRSRISPLELQLEGLAFHRYETSGRDLISKPFLAMRKCIIDPEHPIAATSILRTFVYWQISECAQIVFHPSCYRIPQIDLFTEHIRTAIANQVYEVVAKAFQSTVEAVYDDEVQIPLFLPPTLAIFLESYKRTEDLSEAIDSFRQEFAPIREAFRELQREYAIASTLGERARIKKRVSKILASLGSYHRLESDSALESVVGFAPNVLKPLSNPSDPSKYSKDLLTKPSGWIRDWWIKRPFRHVFHLRDRLHNISHYESLASQVLGVEFDEKEKQAFHERYSIYLDMYGGTEKKESSDRAE